MPLPKSSAVVFFGTLIVVASAGLSFVAVTGFGAPPPQVAAQATVPAAVLGPPPPAAAVPLPVRERSEPNEPVLPPARDREPVPPVAPDSQSPGSQPRADRGPDVRVESRYADINVDRERGRLWVRAPYTAVDVDGNGGRVRVRAPFVDLDIRW